MGHMAGQLHRKLKEGEVRQRRIKAQQGREDARSAEERLLLIAQLKAQSERESQQAERAAANLISKIAEKRGQDVDIAEFPASFEQKPAGDGKKREKLSRRHRAQRPSGSPTSEAPRDS